MARQLLMADRMLKKLGVVLVAFVIATGAGCKKKDPAESKMAKLCVEASKQLAERASSNRETFEMQLSNAFQACSGGCDDGNQESCKSLDAHIAKVCGVSPSMCEQLCTSVKSPSLKKTTCEFKKK